MSLFDYVKSTGSYLSGLLYSAASSAKSFFLDKKIEDKIEEIGNKASEFTADRIQRALYGDPERYGRVRRTGEMVDIYYKNSPILNKLMKSATGYSIDDIINSLPIGIKQIAAPLRTYLENMIANMLIEQISQLSVKKATVAALMAANNKTQAEIEAYIQKTYAGLDGAEAALQEIVQHDAIQAAAKGNVDLEGILGAEGDEAISLMDVLHSYKAQAQVQLNHVLRKALVAGIAEATQTVGGRTAEYGVNRIEDLTTMLTIALVGTGTFPVAAIAGGAAFAANKVKDPITEYVRASAKESAKTAASRYLPQEIIPVDYEALGKVTAETVIEDDMEWELLDYKQPTLTLWAEEKFKVVRTALTDVLNDLRRQFQTNQMHSGSKIPEVMQNWFRDNDFAKLKATRDAYVEAERDLISLQYDLMGVCEYAYGIRDEINGEYPEDREQGLDLCLVELQKLTAQIDRIAQKAKAVAHQNNYVENKQRRDDLVIPSNSRIEQIAKDVHQYVEEVSAAIAEGKEEEARERAERAERAKLTHSTLDTSEVLSRSTIKPGKTGAAASAA